MTSITKFGLYVHQNIKHMGPIGQLARLVEKTDSDLFTADYPAWKDRLLNNKATPEQLRLLDDVFFRFNTRNNKPPEAEPLYEVLTDYTMDRCKLCGQIIALNIPTDRVLKLTNPCFCTHRCPSLPLLERSHPLHTYRFERSPGLLDIPPHLLVCLAPNLQLMDSHREVLETLIPALRIKDWYLDAGRMIVINE